MTTFEDLIDPTAHRHQRRPLGPGLQVTTDGTIALVDGMLNKEGNWGRGIMDAVEEHLATAFRSATFGRVDLDPIDYIPADIWSQAISEDYVAVVITAGDCITCTSRGARSAIAAEERGLPSAIVCTAAVEDVVQAVCDTHGSQRMPTVLIHDSLFGLPRATIAQTVAPSLTGIVAALRRTTQPAEISG